MADNYKKLWVNTVEKQLQRSSTDGTPFIIPPGYFIQYEAQPLQIVLLSPDDEDPFAYNKLNVDNLGLIVSIDNELDGTTPLAQQDTWTKDTSQNTLRGDLDLNTALLNTAMTVDNFAAYLEIEITDGTSKSKVLRASIAIRQGVTQPTTESPDPSKQYYTAQQSEGIFLKSKVAKGVQITLQSPDGSRTRTIGIDDDGNSIDFTGTQ